MPLGPVTTIGRESGNDAVVPKAGVSRRHAEIEETKKGYRLRDLESANGTFVNDRRIGKRVRLLKDGDSIGLGEAAGTAVFRESVESGMEASRSEPKQIETAPPSPTLITSTAAAEEAAPPTDQPTLLMEGGPEDGKLVSLGTTTTTRNYHYYG